MYLNETHSRGDHQWFARVFDDIRRRHPHYGIAILYVYASPAQTLKRAAQRALCTGRLVPAVTIRQSLEQVPRGTKLCVSELNPLASGYGAPRSRPHS